MHVSAFGHRAPPRAFVNPTPPYSPSPDRITNGTTPASSSTTSASTLNAASVTFVRMPDLAALGLEPALQYIEYMWKHDVEHVA